MMIFKKIFLLICLGLGAFVPSAYADVTKDNVDKQINKMVFIVFKNNEQSLNSSSALKLALTVLKKNVLDVIQNHSEEYKNLNESLKSLNLEGGNLQEILLQLKVVVANLPTSSQKFLKNKFPLLG